MALDRNKHSVLLKIIKHEKILSIIRNNKKCESSDFKRAKFCFESLYSFLSSILIPCHALKNYNYREAEKWSYAKN